MPELTVICCALAFVEENLRHEIAVGDMAGAVGYSLYHFCRTFNEATHQTPYSYLMRRRLTEAARVLLSTDAKIIEVALDYQFGNPETFSRAFKRMFGTQPSQLRKQGTIDRRRLMPRLTMAHLQQTAQGPHPRPVLEDREAIPLTGLMTLVQNSAEEIRGLWDLLDRELRRQGVINSMGDRYGLAHYPDGWERSGYFYLVGFPTAGMEAEELAQMDGPFVSRAIPAGAYVRFVHRGRYRDLPLLLDYAYHTWQPKARQALSYRWVVEHYAPGYRGWDHPQSEMAVSLPLHR